ncbi:MAG: DUF885 domain-containing protein [Proteobacteria bacterium]|nr:DUF885 domain-containing protein [Pseudomonadota bacterium]
MRSIPTSSRPTLSLLAPLALTLAAALAGCNPAAASSSSAPANATAPATAHTAKPGDRRPNPAWQGHVDALINGWFEHFPVDAVAAGKHEYDGVLPDYSLAGQRTAIDWLQGQRAAIAAFGDDKLDATQRFQRDYVLAVLDGKLFWMRDSGFASNNPAYYAGDLSPSIYLTRPYAPLKTRMAAFVKYEESLPTAIAQIRANLQAPLPATYVDYGIGVFGGMADFFASDAPKAFATVDDAVLQARLKAVNAKAIEATRGLSDWLKSIKPQATRNFALGAEKFEKMLYATERVDIPLPQLKAAAEADLARNTAALTSACAAYLPGKPIADCVAKVEADKPVGGAVEGARKQLVDLRRFIIDHDLVTIPGTEQAQVAEAPPYNRWNFAYIEIPGPYEKNLPSVYYIAPPDPSWPKAMQEAYVPGKSVLLFTSAHEVFPGHFVQFLHANRSNWIFGRLFVGYAYAEGWAHYCEEMMYDAGLGDHTPEAHIGQLSEALLRDVRFISAIGLHTGGMSVAQSEQMFRDKAYQDQGNAMQQAARGTYDPAYLNYTLGKLMIMQLREDWTATRGGRKAWKAFHDAFLSYGGPPIPLVRAQMLGGKPAAVLWQAPAAKH